MSKRVFSKHFPLSAPTHIDRAGLLNIIDNHRTKRQESEDFVTAATVAPRHWSSWNAELARNLFLLLPPSSGSMTLSRNPASLQIPPESLFFSDSESPHTRPKVPSRSPSFFHSCFRPCMSAAASTFKFHGDAFHLAPQTFCFRRLRFTFQLHTPTLFFFSFRHSNPRSFRRGLIHVFHPLRKLRAHFFPSHAMEDEHDSKEMVSRASDPFLIALVPPNLCNILTFSLSL